MKIYTLLFLFVLHFFLPDHLQAQSLPKLVKAFGMPPGTFAGTMGANLNGKYVTDSLGTLLISDGTDTGTHSVKAFYRISAMLVVNSKLFMIACDSVSHPNQLWVSNGTTAGTHMVKNIGDLTDTSGALYFGFSDYSLVEFHNKVFFFGNDDVHGVELWTSDGTSAGTQMVKDINTIPGSSAIDLSTFPFGNLKVSGDRLFFCADDGIHGPELWSTDGTAANTYMAKDVFAGAVGSKPEYLTAFNNKVCFWCFDGATHYMYISDGSDTGTKLLGMGIWSRNSEQAVLHNRLYFFSDSFGMPGTSSLWSTDGTDTGTRPVCRAFYDLTQFSYKSYLSGFLSVYKDKLYFGAADNLWRSDGTAADTNLFYTFNSNPQLCCTPTQITNFGGKMYMRVRGAGGCNEIVISDSASGSVVALVPPGADYATGSSFVIGNYLRSPVTIVGTKLFFWNTYQHALGHSIYCIDLAATNVFNTSITSVFKIYPNPQNGVFYVEAPENTKISKVEIYGMDGRVLASVQGNQQSKLRINLSEGACTVLILRIYTNNGVFSHKIGSFH